MLDSCLNMEFNLFLWPMILPMILPIFYCFKYKRESLVEILAIILTMIIIVILYWPLSNNFFTSQNILAKFVLFVFLPILILYILSPEKSLFSLKKYGIKKAGFKKSFSLSLLLLPVMLGVTFIIKYFSGVSYDADLISGIISFFESFSEEFFFRGVLFLFLLNKTNLKVAYFSSLFSFILMHPQHLENYTNLFFFSTIVQGVLTIEITRRSENIAGAWILHGINRFFIIAIIPFLLK